MPVSLTVCSIKSNVHQLQKRDAARGVMEYFLGGACNSKAWGGGRGLAASCTTSTRWAQYGQMPVNILLWPIEAIPALHCT